MKSEYTSITRKSLPQKFENQLNGKPAQENYKAILEARQQRVFGGFGGDFAGVFEGFFSEEITEKFLGDLIAAETHKFFSNFRSNSPVKPQKAPGDDFIKFLMNYREK